MTYSQYWQTKFNSTLKGSFTMIKWELCLDPRMAQPMWINKCDTSYKEDEGENDHINRYRKIIWQNPTSFYDKDCQEISCRGFHYGSVLKNSPANAGDMGLIPGQGRSHVLRSSYVHSLQLLNLCSRAWEPATEALVPDSLCSKASLCWWSLWSLHTATKVEPLFATREKPTQQRGPSTAKNN